MNHELSRVGETLAFLEGLRKKKVEKLWCPPTPAWDLALFLMMPHLSIWSHHRVIWTQTCHSERSRCIWPG